MLILQNKLPRLLLSHSSLPKFASQVLLSQLHLRFTTLSTVSSSNIPQHSVSDSLLVKNTYSYDSLIWYFFRSRRYLQSLVLFKKVLPFSKPEISIFPSILKSCSFLPHLPAGLVIHGYLMKCGFRYWVGAGKNLILMYMKFGQARDAYQVFEEMPMRNGDLFYSLVFGFKMNGFYEEAVIAFENMVELRISPNLDSICHVIVACGDLGSIEKGNYVHDYVKENGFDAHTPVANSLISMYVKMRRMDLAHQVFDDMNDTDIVSWNSLITGYAQCGNWAKVFDFFLYMRKTVSLVPNMVTFLALAMASGQASNLDIGMSFHGHLIRTGLYSDFQLGTAIFDMYAKCERVDYARIVFEEDLVEKTLVSWNALLSRYAQNGFDQEAAILYERMVVESNIKPDSISFASVLPAYASLGNLGRIKSIHSLIIKRGLDMDEDVVLCTAMVDAYGKCSDLNAAKSLFTCTQRPNTATWNALISAYNLNHEVEHGMLIFVEMLQNEVLLDPITMVMLFQSCGQVCSLKQGNTIHGFCISKGFSSYLIVGNAILDMYLRCGCVKRSEFFFRSMSIKNIVTWNTMIYGYTKVGHFSTAIRMFSELQLENKYKPDSVTVISLVQAYGAELSHAYTLKLGLASETLVMNSLIDAYAKNGLIENARALFMQIDFLKDRSSWNIMIAGYGMNGLGRESSNLLSKMEEDGYVPDSITLTSLLSSCSHSGLIEEGCRFFDLMVNKYKIQVGMEHWTCIIDMFGRAGRLEEAYEVIKSGLCQNSDNCYPSDCNAVWGALLSACRMNMNMELGELVGQKLSKLEPDNCGYHSLLSNLYSSNKRWDEATKIRRVFEDGRLVKKPGLSIVKY